MYCEPESSHNLERREHSLHRGNHQGQWTRSSLRAPGALHFLATISATSSARYLIERSSPEPNSDPASTLCRSAPTGRARSFLDAANDRLRLYTSAASSTHGHSRRHIHRHRDGYFRYVDAYHYFDTSCPIAAQDVQATPHSYSKSFSCNTYKKHREGLGQPHNPLPDEFLGSVYPEVLISGSVLVRRYFFVLNRFCIRSPIVSWSLPRYTLISIRRASLTGSERRTTQRFSMRLPLTVRWTTGAAVGETSTESRDVSSRGVYFFLSKDVKEGSPVEILLTLPNEITLAGPVRVRCLGRVQRTEPREEGAVGVVAAIERYEFLRGEKSAGRTCSACTARRQQKFLNGCLPSRRQACLAVLWSCGRKDFCRVFCSCGAKVSRRVPCSHTAEAGGIKPGCLGPSAKLPRRFSSATSPSK